MQKGLKNKKCAYLETVRDWGLRQEFGIDFESEIIGSQKRESNAFYEIFGRSFQKVTADQIPLEYLFIERTEIKKKRFLVTKQSWLQHKSENIVIFFLEDELIKLESDFVFADGTFTLTKDLKYTQVYILSILIKKENRTLSYPISFSLMKGRSAQNYRELFKVLCEIFEKKEKRKLKIKRIFSDCEKAIFKPLLDFFFLIYA